jgi:hypothetical protein
MKSDVMVFLGLLFLSVLGLWLFLAPHDTLTIVEHIFYKSAGIILLILSYVLFKELKDYSDEED